MDCNKEEALRAKDIAEKKMESKDFSGAHKLALKAQQLYPDLENIAQMLIVCDVHCSAEQRLYGNEMNWYKILQIELTADDATIKKQYRKFALQLHPDKNKFAGAEAAFKLIGEAQRVLLDRDKRSELDRKCRISVNRSTMPSYHQQKVQMNFNSAVRNTVRPNFMNFHPPWQQQQSSQSSQQGPNGVRRTFWTACSFCSVRYEYHREVLNRSLRCQQCNRPFIAYDVDAQGPTPATNSGQQAFGQQNYGLNHGTFNVGVGSQGNLHANKPNKQSSEKKGSTSDVSRKPNGKRKRKQVSESSESADSSGSSDSEDDMFADNDDSSDVQKQSTYREEHPRRSTRQKQQVSYKENASDDDDGSFQPSRRDKGSGSSGHADEMNHQNGVAADQKEVKKKQSFFYSEEGLVNRNEKIKEVRGKEAVEDSSTDEATENAVVYPDPEFSDFDKDKKEECFAAGQIWAIYDTTDGMPRFYALIRKVLSPGFKVHFTWFEPDPDDDDEINWASEQLPVACGKYRLGSTDVAEGHQTFSHLILCEKIGRRNYKVYPRKGETWALFKNWDIKWYEDAKSHQQYDFEFVEILSDYVEGEGVDVAYLAKLKGFVSLFYPIMKESVHSIQIPSVELFRFSHRVPSFKMTGQEGVGVPVGSFELDPVSLPMNLEEIDVPQDAEVKFCHNPSVGMCSRSSDVLKNMSKSDGDASTLKTNLERSSSARKKVSVDNIDDGSAPSDEGAKVVDLPDPQFFNFDETRSLEKFRIGQIWAFYGDEDGTPKYYGQIMGVRTRPDLELRVTWLTNCWLPEDAVRWQDKNMIISCGRFKIEAGAKSSIYHDTNSFSHQVHAITDGKSKEYGVFPRKGEVWALYRKWTAKIKRSDLSNWEYYIVEVVAESDSGFKVLPLDKVSGFDSVFKSTSSRTMEVARKKLMMFSHQVPAFRLTGEHGNGKLRGWLELDPGALPTHYFSPK